jgi:hypothetical protein
VWRSEEKGRNNCRITTGLSFSEQNACHAMNFSYGPLVIIGMAGAVKKSAHPRCRCALSGAGVRRSFLSKIIYINVGNGLVILIL